MTSKECPHSSRAAAAPVPGYPWVPGLFVIVTLYIGVQSMFLRPWEPIAGLLTPLLGLVVYFGMKWFSRARNARVDAPPM